MSDNKCEYCDKSEGVVYYKGEYMCPDCINDLQDDLRDDVEFNDGSEENDEDE